MAMRNVLVRPGTICALHAACGRYGRSNSPLCVDSNCLPFGMMMQREVCVWHLFLNGVSILTKCPVAPESRMSHFVCSVSGELLSVVVRVHSLLSCFCACHLLILRVHLMVILLCWVLGVVCFVPASVWLE